MIMLTHSVQNMYVSVPGKSLPPVVSINDNVNLFWSKHVCICTTQKSATCTQHHAMIMLTHSVQNMSVSAPGQSMPHVVNTNDKVQSSCSKYAHDLKPLDVVLFAEVIFSCSFEGMGVLNATDVRRETQRIPLLWNTVRGF